jgi:starch phosphorylase
MKAIANGVLSLTVLDGWTHEVDWNGTGWVLDPNNVSKSFYNLMENEIVPLFYERDSNGLPKNWIKMMIASINLSDKFSAKWLLEEYRNKLYDKI